MEKKTRIVLSVLAGEMPNAEAACREKDRTGVLAATDTAGCQRAGPEACAGPSDVGAPEGLGDDPP